MCFSFRLTEMEYEVIADETLDSLAEMFEDLAERIDCDSDYDVLLGVSITVCEKGCQYLPLHR